MAINQFTRITEYGINRITLSHSGEVLVFTAIGLGDGFLPDDLSAVSSLANEKQRFPITEYQVNENRFFAKCYPSDIQDPNGIYVREIGLYVADPEYPNERSRDKLYAVGKYAPSLGVSVDFYVFIPKNVETMVLGYSFAIHAIISIANNIIVLNVSGMGILEHPLGSIGKEFLSLDVQNSLDKADGAYQKPIGGIPKSDLSQGVKDSLDKADAALKTEHNSDLAAHSDIRDSISSIVGRIANLEGVLDDILQILNS